MDRMTTQPLVALRKANAHRLAVALERQSIASLPYWEGRDALADLIESADDPAILSGRIVLYLRAVKRFGDAKSREFCRLIGVTAGDKRLRDLTDRQRKLFAAELRRRP